VEDAAAEIEDQTEPVPSHQPVGKRQPATIRELDEMSQTEVVSRKGIPAIHRSEETHAPDDVRASVTDREPPAVKKVEEISTSDTESSAKGQKPHEKQAEITRHIETSIPEGSAISQPSPKSELPLHGKPVTDQPPAPDNKREEAMGDAITEDPLVKDSVSDAADVGGGLDDDLISKYSSERMMTHLPAQPPLAMMQRSTPVIEDGPESTGPVGQATIPPIQTRSARTVDSGQVSFPALDIIAQQEPRHQSRADSPLGQSATDITPAEDGIEKPSHAIGGSIPPMGWYMEEPSSIETLQRQDRRQERVRKEVQEDAGSAASPVFREPAGGAQRPTETSRKPPTPRVHPLIPSFSATERRQASLPASIGRKHEVSQPREADPMEKSRIDTNTAVAQMTKDTSSLVQAPPVIQRSPLSVPAQFSADEGPSEPIQMAAEPTAVTAPSPEGHGEGRSEDHQRPDLDRLARQVYAIVKRRLAIENERSGFR